MLGTVGDLVEDVVVRLGGPINVASDTDAVVTRRRGGSAANMAVSVVRAGGRARFIGQVGDDAQGVQLVDQLIADGVDVAVRRAGRTGSIVVLVDAMGERTMLRDRAACALLDAPDPAWLDGLTVLHVPAYSLAGEPLASTAAQLIQWAHERGVIVSIDASSSAVLEHQGPGRMRALFARLAPDVLLCNEMEAATLGGLAQLAEVGARLTIVKQGPDDAIAVLRSGEGPMGEPVSVPADRVADVRDTTGAGDAFAAGLLVALAAGVEPIDAIRRGHHVAADAIRLVSNAAAT